MKLTAEIRPQSINVSVNPSALFAGFGAVVARDVVERDPYDGDYAITPSAETQTLATSGKRMTADVVINPIPSNYGLITWDGSKITVS